jgi:hypothetical protein
MQSAPTAFQSYAPNLSLDGLDRRAPKHVTARHSQTAVALGALAAASVATGAGFYFWPSGEQQREAYEAEELPMAGVFLGDHPEPPGPSISFSHPLVPPDDVPLRAKQAGLRSADRDDPASRSRQLPASRAAAAGREAGGQERAQAITREPPSGRRNAAEARLPDSVGPPAPELGRLQADVEAGSSGMAEALALPKISGRSRLDAPALTPSSSTDARFLPILDGIVAVDDGARADRLSAQGGPTPGGQSALSASRPVTTVAPAITIEENELGAISTEMPSPSLAGLTEPPPLLGGPVENPAAAALSESEERSRYGQPSLRATDTPHASDITRGAQLVDEPQAGAGLAGNAAGLSEDLGEGFDAALNASMEPGLTGAHQSDALSVNGASLAVEEEVLPATEAAFVSENLALRSTAQSRAQPRTTHAGIIREDDRVAFAGSESGADPDLVSPSGMATVSLASSADRASEARVDKRASTQAAISLASSADGTIQLRLGDLIALLEDRMERPLFVWLSSAESASKYVTFDTLRAAGIGVDYDPVRNHVVLSVAEEEGK